MCLRETFGNIKNKLYLYRIFWLTVSNICKDILNSKGLYKVLKFRPTYKCSHWPVYYIDTFEMTMMFCPAGHRFL